MENNYIVETLRRVDDYVNGDKSAEPWLVEWGVKGRSFWSANHGISTPNGKSTELPVSYLALRYQRERTVVILRQALEKAEAAYNTVILLLRSLGYTREVRSRGRWIRRAFLLYLEGTFEKWMKFHLCAFFSRATKNELPPCPDEALGDIPGIFVGGGASRFLRNIVAKCLRKPTGRNLVLAQQVLMAKKGFPPVWEWQVEKSLESHKSLLTTDQASVGPRTQRETRIIGAINRVCAEVFGSVRQSDQDWSDTTFHCPSSSAHYGNSRGKGGAAAWISQTYGESGFAGLGLSLEESLLLKDDHAWYGRGCAKTQKVLGDLSNCFNLDPQEDIASLGIDQGRLSNFFGKILSTVSERLEDPMKCVPVGLVEPFKVRVITKEEEEEAYIASYFQKELWGRLHRHPVFELTGRPVTAEDVQKVVGTAKQSELIVSADYSSATDRLNTWAIRATVESLGRLYGWSERMIRFVNKNLSDHSIDYDLGQGKKRTKLTVHQENGQLMGNPISFVILCIINAAVAWLNLDPTYSRKLARQPLKINGDDALLRLSRAQYDIWKADVASVGLELSVGKNYISNDFAIINSTLFVIREEADFFGQIVIEEKPYLSLGLLQCINVKRNQGDGSSDDPATKLTDVEPVWQACARACSESGFDLNFAAEVFLKGWRHVLDACPEGMSWYLPRRLGGLGFGSPKASYTTQQLRIAAYLASPRSLESELELRRLLSVSKVGDACFWSLVTGPLRAREDLFEVFETEPGQESEDVFEQWLPVLGPRVLMSGALLRTSQSALWRKWFRAVWKKGTAHGLLPWIPGKGVPRWREISRTGPGPRFRPTVRLESLG